MDIKNIENQLNNFSRGDEEFKFIVNFLLQKKIYKKDYNLCNSELIYDRLEYYLVSNKEVVKEPRFYFKNIIYSPNYEYSFHNIPLYAFTYWDMSSLSFMHFLTLYTFRKHHPYWTFVLYYPSKRVVSKTWKTYENKMETTTENFFHKLKELNIITVEIDFEVFLPDIPYYLPEVIKSDLFRLSILNSVGGVWIDMDTFWINSLENKFRFNPNNSFNDIKTLMRINCPKQVSRGLESIPRFIGKKKFNDSYYVICNARQDNEPHNEPHFCQYILFSTNNSVITKLLLNQCFNHLNLNSYECIGTPMFSKIVSEYMLQNNSEYDWNKSFININLFAPYKYYEMKILFSEKKQTHIDVSNSCCIHWFNGSDYSKKFLNRFTPNNFDELRRNGTNFMKIFDTYMNNIDMDYFSKFYDNFNQAVTPINPEIKIKQDIKVSIVMAYFNKKQQLEQTLKSIRKSSYKNFEIVIVDDASNEDQKVINFINNVKNELDVKVITISKEEKTWINPCIPYNIGIKNATGDIIIIQNPEVMHVNDCISYVVNNLERGDWISFNCYGSPNFNYNAEINSLENDLDIFNKINSSSQKIGGNSVQNKEVGGWLNHYEKFFVGYHYLGAIHKSDLNEKMGGGFDERFKNGSCLDDDQFIKRLIYNNFNFKTTTFNSGNPFGIHLYHDKPDSVNMDNYRINRKIFDEYCISIGFKPENNFVLCPKEQTANGRKIIK